MLIGRKREIETLKKYYESTEAEFLVVYGRRRVGKTYLIRQYFNDNFFFYATGTAPEDSDKARLSGNLERFGRNLNLYGIDQAAAPVSWMDAFDRLRDGVISSKIKDKKLYF